MSTYEQKRVAPSVRLPQSGVRSLAEDLRQIGAPPLPAGFVAAAMDRAVFQLPPEAGVWQLRIKRMLSRAEKWEVTSLSQYLERGRERERTGVAPAFGWPMPVAVLARARIAETVPGTGISVHALLSDDPWVFVERGSETEAIAGWYGRGDGLRVFLG